MCVAPRTHLLLSCSAVTPVACVRMCAFGMDHSAVPRCCCGPAGPLLWQWMKPSDQPDSKTCGDAATLRADSPGRPTRHSSPSICFDVQQPHQAVVRGWAVKTHRHAHACATSTAPGQCLRCSNKCWRANAGVFGSSAARQQACQLQVLTPGSAASSLPGHPTRRRSRCCWLSRCCRAPSGPRTSP